MSMDKHSYEVNLDNTSTYARPNQATRTMVRKFLKLKHEAIHGICMSFGPQYHHSIPEINETERVFFRNAEVKVLENSSGPNNKFIKGSGYNLILFFTFQSICSMLKHLESMHYSLHVKLYNFPPMKYSSDIQFWVPSFYPSNLLLTLFAFPF